MAPFVRIDLFERPRFNASPRNPTPKERRALETWKTEAIKNNWIQRSGSRHSCSPLFVPKKNGDLRLCINFVPLNNITKSMIYAPRHGPALRSEIQASTWYAKYDLKNAFHTMCIHPADRWKTAFRLPDGIWEWLVMPFGLKNAPGEFQHFIESILAPVLGSNVTVHIDDILVHADTKRKCSALSRQVRKIIETNGFIVNEEKSTPEPSLEVEYCGFRYSHGSCVPIGRYDAILSWPEPKTQTELRSFIASTIIFKDNLRFYAHYMQPLYECTGKSWKWTPRHSRAFQAAKNAMKHVIATARFSPDHDATLITDASLFAKGAILMQDERVIAVWSKALTPAERNYTANERELLAVVDALIAWQHLVEACPTIHVKTDNMINSHMIRPSTKNRRINRWILILSQYTLTWQHIPGVHNPADGFSRQPNLRVFNERLSQGNGGGEEEFDP